ncbi:hypothetical protein [Thalassotalea sp. PP2-459]|uniref:hypothetical protein n=1 Tax=Thalassotalea sp. PP2-459 TaxID=1742724 RepID=UPI000944C481|nr:hypothetical protein [Thalassotalea sp. PP2-459]OKY26319.1 hypothetical protein BI291_12090 [Thalassotalea sp. PP2-459]
MIRLNMHLSDKAENVSLRVCAVNYKRSLAAVSDMTWAIENNNARKPQKYHFDELEKLIADKWIKGVRYN